MQTEACGFALRVAAASPQPETAFA